MNVNYTHVYLDEDQNFLFTSYDQLGYVGPTRISLDILVSFGMKIFLLYNEAC